MLDRFREPDPFRAASLAFGERANFGERPEQKGPEEHGERVGSADMRTAWGGLHGLPQEVQRPRIVAQHVIDIAQAGFCMRHVGEVANGGGEKLGLYGAYLGDARCIGTYSAFDSASPRLGARMPHGYDEGCP